MEKRMCYGGKAVYANISLINSQAFNGLSRGGRGAGALKGKENIKNCTPVCFRPHLQYSEYDLYRSRKTAVTHV